MYSADIIEAFHNVHCKHTYTPYVHLYCVHSRSILASHYNNTINYNY